MAIPGIGLQSSYQLTRPFADQQNSSKSENKNRATRELPTEQTQATATSTDKSENSKTALLAPVEQSANSTEADTSRKNLVEIETARKRFQLQKEENNDKGPSGKALQSFLEVANYERKDELTNMVGIDIFI